MISSFISSSLCFYDDWSFLLLLINRCVSRTATAPLDRVKVILQAEKGTKSSAAFSTLRGVLAREGVAALWRGNGLNVAKIAPETAIKFAAFEEAKAALGKGRKDATQLTVPEKMAAGAVAGAFAQTCIYPMEIIKTRLILSASAESGGILTVAATIFRSGGVAAFFRGYLPNILGVVPYAGIDLTVYECLKDYLGSWWTRGLPRLQPPDSRISLPSPAALSPPEAIPVKRSRASDEECYLLDWDELGLSETLRHLRESFETTASSKYSDASSAPKTTPCVPCLLFCGVVSSTCGQIASYPFALVRVRMQAGGSASMIAVAREVWATSGPRGFYRGLGPNLVKVAPAFAISYAVYENVKLNLGV